MVRITNDFAEFLRDCDSATPTTTAKLLLRLHQDSVSEDGIKDSSDRVCFMNKSITEVGKLSYATQRRIEHYSWDNDEASDLSNERRFKAKVGKTLRKIFTEDYLKDFYEGFSSNFNEDVEKFVGLLKGESFSEENFSYRSCINDSYHYQETDSMAQNGEGTLGDSCMRHDECVEEGYMNIYDDVEIPCSLLVYTDDEGYISGRALIWDIDGSKYMDRIYQSHDGIEDKFKAYARNKGIIYKEYQSYRHKDTWIGINGVHLKRALAFEVCNFDDYSNFPYIDTFSYGFDLDGTSYLTNCKNYAYDKFGVKKFKSFDSTGGCYSTLRGKEVVSVGWNYDESKSSICFDGDWYEMDEESVSRSEFFKRLYFEYESEYISRLCQDMDDDINHSFYRIDGYFYHSSEVAICGYSRDYYPKGEGSIMYCDKVCRAKYFVIDHEGETRYRSDCANFIDLNGDFQFCYHGTVVRDIFGVKRLKEDCFKVDGFSESTFIPKSNIQMIKLAKKQSKLAKGLNETAHVKRFESNIPKDLYI